MTKRIIALVACLMPGLPLLAGWIEGPSGLSGFNDAATVYDSNRHRVVLFGGEVGSHESAVAWEYDGTTWRPGPSAPAALRARDGVAMAYDSIRRRVVIQGGHSIGRIFYNDTFEYDGNRWIPGPQAPAGLTPRHRHRMAFDPTRGRVVLFGGEQNPASGPIYFNDTWEYGGDSWVPGPKAPSALSPRYRHNMVWDPAISRIVLFGGYSPQTGGSSYRSDTWEYDGKSWTPGPAAPPAMLGRRSHGMAYDWTRQRVVLFGGYRFSSSTQGVYLNDLWEFDGTRWVSGSPAPASLTPRTAHTLVYDEARRKAVLFGGRSSNDTWEFDGSSWTERAVRPLGIPSRIRHAMAYDQALGRMVAFGGFGGHYRNDTVEYDGSGWRPGKAAPAGLSGRFRLAMAYDSVRKRIVLFGGSEETSTTTSYYNDTWEYDGSAWRKGPAAPAGLVPRRSHAMAYDRGRKRIVLFGGATPTGNGATYLNDTWEYDGSAWRKGPAAPQALAGRRSHAMAYDGARGVVVLYGGYSFDAATATNHYYGDVWEYNGVTWQPAAAPPPAIGRRSDSRIAEDPDRGMLVLFGGHGYDENNQFSYFTTTWEYDGSWHQGIEAPPGLAYRDGHSMAYDTKRKRMVLFHGAETWEYDLTKDGFLVGAGLGAPNPNRVRVMSSGGGATSVDFMAYGAGQWGTNVAAGNIDGATTDEILTGPGPGAVYGPQIRAFHSTGSALSKVNFFAYGTLRYGANVASGDVDSDGSFEILSSPGPGAVFGPHIRGFNYDGGPLKAMAKISYFAYGTLKFGAKAATGDLDRDGYAEILTGPGAGVIFSPQVRGFNFDASSVTPMGKVNFNAFSVKSFGVNIASGDFDKDGYDEIAASKGPGSSLSSQFRGFDFDAGKIAALPGFDVTAFPTMYGGRVGAADVRVTSASELLTGAGRDPAADSMVHGYAYQGGALSQIPALFEAFPGTAYGVNVTGGSFGL